MAISSEAFDIVGGVLDIQVCSDSSFIFHEAQIPIWDVVMVEPLDRLLNRDLVEMLYEQSVRDDANAHLLC
jgi:hypothetical protein